MDNRYVYLLLVDDTVANNIKLLGICNSETLEGIFNNLEYDDGLITDEQYDDLLKQDYTDKSIDTWVSRKDDVTMLQFIIKRFDLSVSVPYGENLLNGLLSLSKITDNH